MTYILSTLPKGVALSTINPSKNTPHQTPHPQPSKKLIIVMVFCLYVRPLQGRGGWRRIPSVRRWLVFNETTHGYYFVCLLRRPPACVLTPIRPTLILRVSPSEISSLYSYIPTTTLNTSYVSFGDLSHS